MLRLWQTAVSPVDAFYAQMAEGVFRAVKWAIAEKINQQADNDGPLSSCDLRIYDYYKKLMFYYNNAMRLFAEAAAETKAAGAERANGILTGMTAVVLSRIKSFLE